jgi:hypothetical protein
MVEKAEPKLMRDILGCSEEHIDKRLAATRPKSAKDKYDDFTCSVEKSPAQEVFDLLISELAWGSTVFRVEVSLTALKDWGAVEAFGMRYLESRGYVCNVRRGKAVTLYDTTLEYVDFYIDWEATEKNLKEGEFTVRALRGSYFLTILMLLHLTQPADSDVKTEGRSLWGEYAL